MSVISINLLCKFIEITFRHGCSLVNLLYIFRKAFTKNAYGRLLLFFLFEMNSHEECAAVVVVAIILKKR